jgi:probable O-glycosylation ligase (exosortase A-associated)
MLLLLGLVYLSVIFAVYPQISYHKFYEFVKVMLVAMLTVILLHSKQRVRILFWAIALSLGFYGVKNGLTLQVTQRGPGGMLYDNNDFSAALVMNLPFLYYLARTEANVWVKRGFYAAVPLSIVAILLTESRGGFLALGAVIVVLILKSRNRVVLLALSPLAVAVVLAVLPQRTIDRFASIKNYEEDNSAQARLQAWGVALEMSADYPWFGCGYRNFQSVYNDYAPEERNRVAHNSYLQLMAESGRPSLAVFLILLLLTILNSRRLQKEGRRIFGPDHWFVAYSAAIEVAFYGYLVGAMFLNRAHFDLLYHLIGISIALNVLARAEMREAAAAPIETEVRESGKLVYETGF